MTNNAEQKFFDALREIFVGAEIEGQSGYINLMKIKSRYYQEGVFPALTADITRVLEPFPDFRKEMFNKLYSFFKRYFSESGSIYFRFTPPHEHVYEKVYTDDRDVTLFWKTHMLYYVKTDRIFQGMQAEMDGFQFAFDVAALEHKQANEKRSLVFDFKERRGDGALAFTVTYSQRGRKTRLADIRRGIKTVLGLERYTDQVPSEETLERAFRVFERQSEVDYFINKNARQFLREQFHLWLYQYVFPQDNENPTVWTEKRIKQLQALQEIAYKIIDFIAQFEDELVRIWNKPKFALNSHYVLTLDRLLGLETGPDLWARVMAHPGFAAQMQEWRDLGMVDETFTPDLLTHTNLFGEPLYARYQYLLLDTRHFPDLKAEIIAQFDHLDQELDGWLIHSENYQALNTLLPKFRERVQVIYIDPPYNTNASAIVYVNNYKDATWLSLMENRCSLAKNYLLDNGTLSVAIDDEEVSNLRHLLSVHFPKELGIIAVRSNPAGRKTKGKFSPAHEYVLVYGKSEESVPFHLDITEKRLARYPHKDEIGHFAWANFIRSGSNDKRDDRPKLHYPIFVTDKDRLRIPKMKWDVSSQSYMLEETPKENESVVYPVVQQGDVVIEKNWQRGHIRVATELENYRIRRSPDGHISIDFKTYMDERSVPTTWWGAKEYASANYGAAELKALFGAKGFDFSKSIRLVEDSITTSGSRMKSSLVFDFFAGSGTTAHAVMNLNREDGGKRKYILVEMGEHFNAVILPRVKKVAFSNRWKDGKAQDDGQGLSHFVKYYALEQYEDALRRASYQDADLFHNPQADPYNTYVFMRDAKLLDNAQSGQPVLEIDAESQAASVHPERLYENIDLAETLSCITGQWIRRITPEYVEFEDGQRADLQNPDWQLIKPLIWW